MFDRLARLVFEILVLVSFIFDLLFWSFKYELKYRPKCYDPFITPIVNSGLSIKYFLTANCNSSSRLLFDVSNQITRRLLSKFFSFFFF